jgi:RNA polymerase sigma-70 factor (ECF subfamily)
MPKASRHGDTDALIERASWGDEDARRELFQRYRERLKRMVAVRLDSRLQARFDPSDVVQDVLREANQNLKQFVQERQVPFVVWIREIAWKRLADLRRKHLGAARRSVLREASFEFDLPPESSFALADRLLARGPSPSAQAMLNERRARVHAAMESLPPLDREVLVLRYLEQLSPVEIAEVLGTTRGAVSTRHTRALARLRELLDDEREVGR